MNNRDFAKLAKTPMPNRFGGSAGGGGGGGGGSKRDEAKDSEARKEINRQRQEEKQAKAKAWRMKNAPQNKKKADEEGYRDRASERRDGGEGDYEGVSAEQAAALAQQGQAAGALQGEGMSSLEASKYLGGDMEHTHLVKGLDMQLLNKVRDDLKKQKIEQEAEAAADGGGGGGADDGPVVDPKARSALAKGILLAITAESSYRASLKGDADDDADSKKKGKDKKAVLEPLRGERAKDIVRTQPPPSACGF